MTADEDAAAVERLEAEIRSLREQLQQAEQITGQTLLRATRLSQVISVLAHDTELDAIVERAAVEVGELFAADVALLMLGADDALTIAGNWGVRPRDCPGGTFVLPGAVGLSARDPVSIGPAQTLALPEWLDGYDARHVAWARLSAGEESLGLMLLVRRAEQPFDRADAKELRAITHRVAMAIENGKLHTHMREQLARLRRLQELTTELAGTLDLDGIGRRLAHTLVSEIPVRATVISLQLEGEEVVLTRAGIPVDGPQKQDWERFPLRAADNTVGWVQVSGAPPAGTDGHELLLHLVGLAALALDKALMYEHTVEQARRDSLTGLLSHRAFHEELKQRIRFADTFSLVMIDIDDFKQTNDLFGHQAGDLALRAVAEAMRASVRNEDTVFRIGGEEFCAVLPGLGHDEAFGVAERLRMSAGRHDSAIPITISLGIASFPDHGERRDELLAHADSALYASKRHGKNRTSIAGTAEAGGTARRNRTARLVLLQEKSAETVVHSVRVATVSVDVARALGVPDQRLEDLRTAAQLHDIGKLGVPDAILNKPGPLTEDEMRIVRTHPTLGAELLRAWSLTRPARFVLEHHENVDGTGYPAGLRGDQLALESRIIRVVDAYVAMTCDRPYRKALGAAAALQELGRCRGTQFDAEVVDAVRALEHPNAARAAA